MRPRTKHLNIKYHHFREEVKKETVSMYHVGTKEQIADIFTKPLEEGLFKSEGEIDGMVGKITLYRYNEMRECEDIQVMWEDATGFVTSFQTKQLPSRLLATALGG